MTVPIFSAVRSMKFPDSRSGSRGGVGVGLSFMEHCTTEWHWKGLKPPSPGGKATLLKIAAHCDDWGKDNSRIHRPT
jgi:hypothetical protein